MSNPLGGLMALLSPSTTATPSKGLLGDPQSQMMLGASLLSAGGPSLTPKSGFEGIPQTMALMQRQQMLKQEQEFRNQERERAEQQQQAQAEFLKSQNINPLAPSWLQKAQFDAKNGQAKPSYKVVNGHLFNENTGDWLSPPGGNAARGGLGVTWGVDANGNPVPLQTRSDGQMIPYEMPDGISPTSPFELSRDRAAGSTFGKKTGEAQFTFTGKAPGIENSLRLVDEVINHPSLKDAVGPIDGRLPSFTAGSRDFDERVEQLKGEAFMAARQELKGGGQITDYEGQRAEAALVRASQAKSEADFVKAMNEFKDAITRGYKQLAKQAGQDPETQQPTIRYKYNPETGEIE